MAYRDKEREKEYQRQYYWNRTKLKRKTTPVKSYYKKKTDEEKAENRRIGAIKRKATMLAKLGGEEEYKEYLSRIGKRGMATLRSNGTPIGFQAGYAKEAQVSSAQSRTTNSKHRKRVKNGAE